MDNLIRFALAGALAGAIVGAIQWDRTNRKRKAEARHPPHADGIPVINPVEELDRSIAPFAPL